MNCDAAIFDLDGTILDSLWVWEDISKDFLSKKGRIFQLLIYKNCVQKVFKKQQNIL